MTTVRGTLVAVEGVNGAAVRSIARAVVGGTDRRERGGISRWDASGIFEELAFAGKEAGMPSARTLLLLYAADLAFRLRWEIRPALAEGKVVVAAPYVATAIAFGRAAGIGGAWLTDLFRFAPPPGETRYVDSAPARAVGRRGGFIEFGFERLATASNGPSRQDLVDRARAYLQMTSRRSRIRTGSSLSLQR